MVDPGDQKQRQAADFIKRIVLECMDDRSVEWVSDEEKIEMGIKESYRESMLKAEGLGYYAVRPISQKGCCFFFLARSRK